MHEGSVTIDTTNKSVDFHYAGQRLFRTELQLPTDKGGPIKKVSYRDFGKGMIVNRIEVERRVLDYHHNDIGAKRVYKRVQNALQEEAKHGKKLAMYDNTFKPILDGFEGTAEERIRAMQFLR